MDFGLTNAFNNAVNRYGLTAALVGVSLLVVIYLCMKYAMAKVDKDKAEFDSRLRMAEKAAADLATERKALVDEIKAAREQNQRIVENHLAHDAEDREVLVKTLAAMQAREEVTTQALRELSTSIAASREDAGKRSAALHERLNAIHLDVVAKRAVAG